MVRNAVSRVGQGSFDLVKTPRRILEGDAKDQLFNFIAHGRPATSCCSRLIQLGRIMKNSCHGWRMKFMSHRCWSREATITALRAANQCQPDETRLLRAFVRSLLAYICISAECFDPTPQHYHYP